MLAGAATQALFWSDGTAVACGLNDAGQLGVPALVVDLIYTRVAAGGGHAALLKGDGAAMACGLNDEEQCDLLRCSRI